MWSSLTIFLISITLGCCKSDIEKIQPYYQGCDETKGCLGYPHDCELLWDCDFLLSYTDDGSGIVFNMTGILNQSNYMAMAFSNDPYMGDDVVTDCYWKDLQVFVRRSYNIRRTNRQSRKRIKNPSGRYIEGVHSCSWREDYTLTIMKNSYSLVNTTYNILLARGPIGQNDKKTKHFVKVAYEEKVNLTFYKSLPLVIEQYSK